MLHIDNEKVRQFLLLGNFGLEKESLRITREGNFSHTENPFPNHPHIVRDFCENQAEINTDVMKSADEAVESLYDLTCTIQRKISNLNEGELLWPFSNPPYIINEKDIPIAIFYGDEAEKTSYREYLADRYGRYKMTFCGIHVNFSFSDELLEADFEASGQEDFLNYKNNFYLKLAQRLSIYGWILTAITAASPLLDRSFIEKGQFGGNVFNGMASIRCSELGYWNHFSPLFDYSSVGAYADSINKYVNNGLIAASSELYYPIRVKPRGKYDLEKLRTDGVSHIEMRMFDLNPLCKSGLDVRDVKFAHLLILYLASIDLPDATAKDQAQAVQNFKNAAHYDLKTVKIVMPNGEAHTVVSAALKILDSMCEFYKDFDPEIIKILEFEKEKFITPEARYAWQIREEYKEGFVEKGLILAKQLQQDIIYVEPKIN